MFCSKSFDQQNDLPNSPRNLEHFAAAAGLHLPAGLAALAAVAVAAGAAAASVGVAAVAAAAAAGAAG